MPGIARRADAMREVRQHPNQGVRFMDNETYATLEQQAQQRAKKLAGANIIHWLQRWELAVREHADANCLIEAETRQCWSYGELDHLADTHAELCKPDTSAYIAIRADNSAAFVVAYLAVLKAGCVPVLLNAREKPDKLAALMNDLGIERLLNEAGPAAISASLRQPPLPRKPSPGFAEDGLAPAAIIFTSGTTGPSKAAQFSHRRLIGAGVAWGVRTGMSASSRCYITTPMWHGNGLAVAFAACVECGACAVVRRRFSTSRFWDDIARYDCSSMVYVGELWRYLLHAAGAAERPRHRLRTIFGNGLDQTTWQAVKARFGIRYVLEHYGATEMPGNAMFNGDGKPGACGYVPPGHLDESRYCLLTGDGHAVGRGQCGELLIRVEHGRYLGYTDERLSQQRIVRNVLQPGDCWWRSGDRLRWEEDGYFHFEGRLCENFRWKGENISAQEVEQALLASGVFAHACVYSVDIQGQAGSAPMAAVWPVRHDWHQRAASVLRQRLADYAIPPYLRVVDEAPCTTSTMKIRRETYRAMGYATAPQQVWRLLADAYVPMHEAMERQSAAPPLSGTPKPARREPQGA